LKVLKYFCITYISAVIALLKHGAKRDIKSTEDPPQLPKDLAKDPGILSSLEAVDMDLFVWLHTHNLDELCVTLQTEGVTLPLLATLSEEEMKEMDIKLGLRKKLTMAINQTFKSGSSIGSGEGTFYIKKYTLVVYESLYNYI
jgi:hypothetical protein